MDLQRQKIDRNRDAGTLISVLLAIFLLGIAGHAVFAGEIKPVNGVPHLPNAQIIQENVYFQGPLKVVTLNVAHGRKTDFHQVLLSAGTIRQNLVDISMVLKKASADIVALQEADGPSWWSGDFDHVALLAGKTGLSWYSLAPYMDVWGLKYGAAILSRRPYLDTGAHRFEASWPSPAKGFLIVRFGWYPEGSVSGAPVCVDAISVHLDFSRPAVRALQISELRKTIAGKGSPLIIMGDFNSDWLSEDSVVEALARQSGLQVYHAEATHLATYGARRLDWILISNDLEFLSYAVLPDQISDHLAIIAEIGLKP